MTDNIDKWAKIVADYTPLDRARDLFHRLEINHAEITNISQNIKRAETEQQDPDILQHLYMNEFRLLMENVGLFEDILINLDRVTKNPENEFEVARIRKYAPKFCLVNIMEIRNDHD